MSEPSLVEVYAAANSAEAQFVRERLEAAGIKARIVGEGLQTAQGGVPVGWTIAPRIWVFEADEARAREILAELDETDRPQLSPWTCPQCGEEVEGSFDICWNCQHSRNSS